MSETIRDIHTHRPGTPGSILSVRLGIGSIPDAGLYSLGLHPWDVSPGTLLLLDQLEEMCRDPRLVAIGEAGLDRLCPVPPALQAEAFTRQAAIADRCRKPLIIHNVRCTAELVELRRQLRPTVPWIVHGFRGKPQLARQMTAHGFLLSFGARFNPDTVRALPIGTLLTETDESEATIGEVRDGIARAIGMASDQLDAAIDTHTADVFALPALPSTPQE